MQTEAVSGKKMLRVQSVDGASYRGRARVVITQTTQHDLPLWSFSHVKVLSCSVLLIPGLLGFLLFTSKFKVVISTLRVFVLTVI